MIPLKVLGDRVLVKPDVLSNAPVQTDSGVVIALSMAAAVTGEDATKSVTRGTVMESLIEWPGQEVSRLGRAEEPIAVGQGRGGYNR